MNDGIRLARTDSQKQETIIMPSRRPRGSVMTVAGAMEVIGADEKDIEMLRDD